MVFLMPLAFQMLRGVDAASSGAMLAPFLIANVVGAYSAGQAARWIGRMRPGVIVGTLLAAPALAVLGWLGGAASWGAMAAPMLLAAAGLGVCMPSSLVIAQNAADQRDVGAGTGVLVLMRNLGGAFGTAICGTVLAQGFGRSLQHLGGGTPTGGAGLDLGALRGSSSLSGLDPHLAALARAALGQSFSLAFYTCALLAFLALVAALCMRDVRLRTSAD
jgi:MFS family permease